MSPGGPTGARAGRNPPGLRLARARAASAALALAAGLGLTGAAAAQSSALQPSTSTVAIVRPIVVTKTSDLAFGTVVRPASGSGNVIVDATTGSRTVTGNVTALSGGPSAPVSRAAFTLSGEGGQNFSVAVPSSFNMTLNGQNAMAVTLNATMGGGTLSGTFGGVGSSSFGIGGQLTVSSGTPSGAYTGTFTVTVAYN